MIRHPNFLRATRTYIEAQCKEERRSLADRAFGPDGTAMAAHDALHRGKPDSGPRELSLRMQTLKRLIDSIIGKKAPVKRADETKKWNGSAPRRKSLKNGSRVPPISL
jgi:hypothetical protein